MDLKDVKWYALCKVNPFSIEPIFISIDKTYCEHFLKNGGNFRVIEVKPADPNIKIH